MNKDDLFSTDYDLESLAACDTTLLKELLAQNLKEIQKSVAKLSEINRTWKNEKSEKATA